MRRLLGVDAGLDRDQGLGGDDRRGRRHGGTAARRGRRRGVARAARVLSPAPGAAARRAAARRPLLWLVVAYLGSLARCSSPRSGPRTPSPATWSARSPSTTSRPSWATRSTARSPCARVGVAVGGDGDRRPHRAARSRSSWPRSPAPRAPALLVVAMLTPLWASYLVKAYAWRVMLAEDGAINWALHPFGLQRARATACPPRSLTLAYLWLPYMILPIYAGPRAGARLAARGLRRPRRAGRPHLPVGRAAAAVPVHRRRVDLHVLAAASATTSPSRSSAAPPS